MNMGKKDWDSFFNSDIPLEIYQVLDYLYKKYPAKKPKNFHEKALMQHFTKGKKTKGRRAMFAYFCESMKRDSVQKKIKRIRKKYKIPQNGLKEDFDGTLPEKYVGFAYDEIELLCEDLCLMPVDWMDQICCYILFNDLSKIESTDFIYDCCVLGDMPQINHPISNEINEEVKKYYPINIKVSPYASLNMILDFIKTHSTEIRNLQKGFKSKGVDIGKIREKNAKTEERNDLILKLHMNGVSNKEIAKRIKDKYRNDLDEHHIAAVISSMKRRREK